MQPLGILASCAAGLPPETLRRLTLLAEWDLSRPLARVKRRLDLTPDAADNIEAEYRRFFGLIAINSDVSYGMAGQVDEMWHEHLMYSEDYLDMCKAVVGRMVHHCPLDANFVASDKPFVSFYDKHTRPALVSTYGTCVATIWPERAEDYGASKCCGHNVGIDASV